MHVPRIASLRFWSTLSLTLFAASAAHASLITFETTPGGLTPLDNADLTASYADGPTTVTFGISTTGGLTINDDAVFEHRGTDTDNAYISSPNATGHDQDADNSGGDWFLRAPGSGNTIALGSRAFLIVYSGVLPTAAAGTIWDIDGNESNTVRAYGSSDNLLATVVLHPSDGGDSLPALFSFSGLSAPIAKIQITGGGPLGFDNFNATQPTVSTPAPATLLLLGAGLLGLGRARRRIAR